jgi:hypothetical protein
VSDLVLRAKAAVVATSPAEFFSEWFLHSPPFAFRATSDSYGGFRREIADLLAVHTCDSLLVGSAQLGFSLNPENLLRKFGSHSDLDLAIISPSIFENAWLDLLGKRHEISLLDQEQRQRFRKTKETFFSGYLRPDELPTVSMLLKDWFPKLAGPFRTAIATRLPVRAWLFRSWWHMEAFYCDGIARVRPGVAKLLKGAHQ